MECEIGRDCLWNNDPTHLRHLKTTNGCEEVGVVKRVHTLLGGLHRLATALKVVEEVQEEVQEIKDE